MANEPKKRSIESAPDVFAHLMEQIDKLQKDLDTRLKAVDGIPSAEHVSAMVMGAAAMIEARFKQSQDEMSAFMTEIKGRLDTDSQKDDRSTEAITQLTAAVQALVGMERAEPKPVKRTGTIKLPSGDVSITIT